MKPSIIQLDPNGDAILSVTVPGDGATTKTKEFLVSTTVLGLESPVFAKMFQSDFSEGVAVKEGKRPAIELKEDDPNAMDAILRVLHHKSDNLSDDVSPREIALIATHADKYQLQGPLKPWASVWCHERRLGENAPQDYYYLMLLAAWVFRLDSFTSISERAIEDLKPGFTDIPETVELPIQLPPWVAGSVSSNPLSFVCVLGELDTDEAFIAKVDLEIKSLRDRFNAQIQFVERKLRARKAIYRTPGRVCAACSDVYSASDSECCNGAGFRPKMCNHEHRAFEYFSLIARCELWPPAQYFETLSASEIIDRLPRVQKKLKTHHCDGHDNCPLRKEMEGLVESMRDCFDGIKGLEFPEEEEDDGGDEDNEDEEDGSEDEEEEN